MGLRPSYDPKCSHNLYLWPLLWYCNDGSAWYSCQAIGVHMLQNVTSVMCAKAGLTGKCTNHGLKATSATRLFLQGLDKQLVCKITGNSSEAMRAYKRKSSAMQENVSNVLYGNQAMSDCKERPAKKSLNTVSETKVNSDMLERKLECSKAKASCDVSLKNLQNEGMTTNVTYNMSKDEDKYVVDVYPLINIAGHVPSGHPIVINVNLNIEKWAVSLGNIFVCGNVVHEQFLYLFTKCN